MTTENLNNIFAQDEKDILQEVMNIGFGQASAELAEVIDIFVILSVPDIQVLKGSDLPDYLCGELQSNSTVNIIEQSFLGKFAGQALLIFPSGAEKDLLTLFNSDQDYIQSENDVDMDTLEQETLIEVGNILIGACIGKIAELLDDVVTYDPPRLIAKDLCFDDCNQSPVAAESFVISIRTVFRFEQQNVEGYLFLITNQKSIDWLKKALLAFLESFG
ncbi:chemotaxis protein CheC [uncultured Desulfuromonas sp.]|uniref:chemotaxis protein CheC n=1 Tax=uncultured Desulfuromonas sp. TaxID=181013 RepID=UPI002AAAB354|nr:chemotaxis protein CheC [uncultured Desulfuromonas sp.]